MKAKNYNLSERATLNNKIEKFNRNKIDIQVKIRKR